MENIEKYLSVIGKINVQLNSFKIGIMRWKIKIGCKVVELLKNKDKS